jgi:hypothetical protein
MLDTSPRALAATPCARRRVPVNHDTTISGRVCTCCRRYKQSDKFYKRSARGNALSSLSSLCRACTLARIKTVIPSRACEQCQALFTPKRGFARFCSHKCGAVARSQPTRKPRIINGQSRCMTCGVRKPISEFTPRKDRNGVPISSCRPCMSRISRDYNASDVGKDRRYARKYGVSLEWYQSEVRRLKGRCPLCLLIPVDRLVIDHCHVSNKVRGLLCKTCNVGIGLLRDDEHTMRRAADYVAGTRLEVMPDGSRTRSHSG